MPLTVGAHAPFHTSACHFLDLPGSMSSSLVYRKATSIFLVDKPAARRAPKQISLLANSNAGSDLARPLRWESGDQAGKESREVYL